MLAYHAWATENNGFVPVERIGPGYVAQEIERRMKAEDGERKTVNETLKRD